MNYQKIGLAYRKEDIHMSCCLLVNHNKQNEYDSDALPFNFNVRTMFVILAAPWDIISARYIGRPRFVTISAFLLCVKANLFCVVSL